MIYCMTPVFPDIDDQFRSNGKYIFSISDKYCLALPLDCSKGSCSSAIVFSWQSFSFLLSFFSSSSYNFLSLFLETADKCSLFHDNATQKLWASHQLNASKIARMVCYNHRPLMILVNDAKYIHLLLIFSTSSRLFILQL